VLINCILFYSTVLGRNRIYVLAEPTSFCCIYTRYVNWTLTDAQYKCVELLGAVAKL
jgi:hypothetical protein